MRALKKEQVIVSLPAFANLKIWAGVNRLGLYLSGEPFLTHSVVLAKIIS